jgi:hypothetical protein
MTASHARPPLFGESFNKNPSCHWNASLLLRPIFLFGSRKRKKGGKKERNQKVESFPFAVKVNKWFGLVDFDKNWSTVKKVGRCSSCWMPFKSFSPFQDRKSAEEKEGTTHKKENWYSSNPMLLLFLRLSKRVRPSEYTLGLSAVSPLFVWEQRVGLWGWTMTAQLTTLKCLSSRQNLLQLFFNVNLLLLNHLFMYVQFLLHFILLLK